MTICIWVTKFKVENYWLFPTNMKEKLHVLQAIINNPVDINITPLHHVQFFKY